MIDKTGKLLVIKMQQQWQHIEDDLLAAAHQTCGYIPAAPDSVAEMRCATGEPVAEKSDW